MPKYTLIYVKDIHNRRYRIAQEHYDSSRTLLSLFNQFGKKLADNPRNKGEPIAIHRDNIAHIITKI
ncbi:MAG: hypothetical protein IPM39_24980 [Chloroflexi bacterium]|nr:hypothetical protein [Chloroflexota bacterium]